MSALLSRSTGSRQSSDLSKHSKEVFAEADQHPIIITRRDGQNLVLMSEREVKLRERALQVAAQIIAATTDDNLSLGTRMARSFDWMMALGAQSREECATELVGAARAAFSTKEYRVLLNELTAWKETATAIAAGLKNPDLEWFDTIERVERP